MAAFPRHRAPSVFRDPPSPSLPLSASPGRPARRALALSPTSRHCHTDAPLTPTQLLPPTPLTHATGAAFAVLTGRLSNLGDLLERASTRPEDGTTAPQISWEGWNEAAVTGRATSLAAEVLLHCVARTKPDELVALLAELQGPHAFVVYDGARRVVLAARSACGACPLWMAESFDGGVGFTDDPAGAAAAGWRGGAWRELPPGFYVGGRPEPRARQYALTPAELTQREKRARDADRSGGVLLRSGSALSGEGAVRAPSSRSALAAKLASFGRKGDRVATSL